jgi:hypothetical protein
MRVNRLVLLGLLVMACKTQVPSSTSTYSEDLGVHRLDLTRIQRVSDSIVTIEEPVDVAVAEKLPTEITTEIDSVNQLIIAANREQKLWDGFVIQVYRGSSRSDAYSAQRNINDLYPEMETEVKYYQPTYRVKAGKYFDRLEAARDFQIIKEIYPRALLVPDKLPLQITNE